MESTSTPHGHWCGWYISDPNCRAQAIRRDESASFKPKDDIGKAYKKSEAFSEDTASSQAASFFVGAESIRFPYLLLYNGESHSHWKQGLCGKISDSSKIFHSEHPCS